MSWDRNDAAEWAKVPEQTGTPRAHRAVENEFRRLESPGWDRGDAAEWAPVPAAEIADQHDEARLPLLAPEPPAIRVWVIAVAFVLIVLAGVVGILGTTPGVVNGATFLTWGLGAVGIGMVVREVRR